MIDELIQMMTQTHLSLGSRLVPHRGRLIGVPVIEVRVPDEYHPALLRPLLEVIATEVEAASEKHYGWTAEFAQDDSADGELRGHVGLLAGTPDSLERGRAFLETVMHRLEASLARLRAVA